MVLRPDLVVLEYCHDLSFYPLKKILYSVDVSLLIIYLMGNIILCLVFVF